MYKQSGRDRLLKAAHSISSESASRRAVMQLDVHLAGLSKYDPNGTNRKSDDRLRPDGGQFDERKDSSKVVLAPYNLGLSQLTGPLHR